MDSVVAMFPEIHYYRIYILSAGSVLKCRHGKKSRRWNGMPPWQKAPAVEQDAAIAESPGSSAESPGDKAESGRQSVRQGQRMIHIFRREGFEAWNTR